MAKFRIVGFVFAAAIFTALGSLGLLFVNNVLIPRASLLTSTSLASAIVSLNEFPEGGIYYYKPVNRTGNGLLTRTDGLFTANINMYQSGFDVHEDRLVYTDNGSTIVIVWPNLQETRITVSGLYYVSRPSLSPDSTKVVLQASEVYTLEESSTNFNIYVVDLVTGQFQRIAATTANEESPKWFPRSNKIAYSSFSASSGLDLHVYDLDLRAETNKIVGAGGIHIAVSPDETHAVDFSRLRIYDLATGSFTSIREQVVSSLISKGYDLDIRFSGQANRGTFPLSGDYSADGRSIVFDGAVKKDNDFGIVICQVDIDGSNFRILTDLIQVEPFRSNNNNYSQLTPIWL